MHAYTRILHAGTYTHAHNTKKRNFKISLRHSFTLLKEKHIKTRKNTKQVTLHTNKAIKHIHMRILTIVLSVFWLTNNNHQPKNVKHMNCIYREVCQKAEYILKKLIYAWQLYVCSFRIQSISDKLPESFDYISQEPQ